MPQRSPASRRAIRAAVIESLEDRVLMAAKLLGLDVSEYQGTLSQANWNSVASSGRQFVIMRASSSTGYVDAKFTNNAPKAIAAGMYVGFYHFAYYNLAGHTALLEADHYWATIAPYMAADGKHLQPMLDIEEGTVVADGGTLSAWIEGWCQEVMLKAAAAGYSVRPMIYLSGSHANTYIDSSIPLKYPLVVAQWPGGIPANLTTTAAASGNGVWLDTTATGPNYYQSYDAWQYADNGSVPGIVGNVDLDVWQGDAAAIQDYVVGTSRFAAGSRVVSNASNSVVAGKAWTTSMSSSSSTAVPIGTVGTVIGGPVYSNSFERYRVKFDNGTLGWIADYQTYDPGNSGAIDWLTQSGSVTDPVIQSITTAKANGTYKAGATMTFTINFSKAVTVTGSPLLALNSGGSASYTSGSGTKALVFTYTVSGSQASSDLDYSSSTALTLNGGTMVDTAAPSTNAYLVLPDPTDTGGYPTSGLPTVNALPAFMTSIADTHAIIIDSSTPLAPTNLDLATASDTGSSNTDNLTYNTVPTITGIAKAGDTVTLYRAGTIQIGSVVVPAGGAWSILSSPLPQGVIAITATDTNPASTVSPVSATLNITIDTASPPAPSTPNLAPASDSGSSNSDDNTKITTPTFTGTAEAGSTVTLFRAGSTVIGSGLADGSGNWTIVASTLPAGVNSINASTTDVAGNGSRGSASLTVAIDTTAPTAPATPVLAAASDSGSSSTDNITNLTLPTFTGAAGAAEAGSTLSLFDNSTSIGTATVAGDGSWSITLASPLSSGNHSITAKATDPAGNLSVASSPLTVTIDTTAPTVASIVRNSASPINAATVTWTVTFNESVTGVDLSDFNIVVGGGITGASLSSVTGSGATYTVTTNTGDGNGTIGLNLTDDNSILDLAGNTLGGASAGDGNFAGQVYTVNHNVPPQPLAPVLDSGSDSGVAGDNITNLTKPTFIGAAGAAGANLTITVFDGTTVLGTTTSAADGSWSFTVPPANSLTDGTHAITVTASDAFAVASAPSSATSLTIDTAIPSIVSITRTSATITGASSVAFTVTFSESVVNIDSADFQVVTTGSVTGASISGISGSGASYTVTVGTGTGNGGVRLNLISSSTISDVAGNSIGASSFVGPTYIIDKTAPVVNSINRISSSPSNSSTVQWSVSFSETVTGVDVGDFSIAGTIGDGSITGITGSGSSYVISATTGTGDGTLGLNLVDDDSIADTAGNSLGGTGAGNGNFSGQAFTIDRTPPTAALVSESPANNTSTFDFTIVYTDATSGLDTSTFDSSDVTVSGPGGFVANASFVSTDVPANGSPRTVTYRIAAPGGSWDVADDGTYTVTLNGNQVRDLAQNYANSGTVGTFDFEVPFANVSAGTLTIDYNAGQQSVGITKDESGNIVLTEDSTLSFDLSTFNTIVINGTSGSEGVVISTAISKPLAFMGQTGNDTIAIDSGGSYTFATDIGANSSNLRVIVEPGGSAAFASSQHLAGLTVDGTASITPGDSVAIMTSDLQVNGKLDLGDGAIIVDYTTDSPIGTWDSGSYSGISGMVAQGRNGGTWDGTAGIVTSMSQASAPGALTTIGVAESSAALGLTPGHTVVWLGQTVDDTAVLIRYTYTGDANLSGTINGDDYFMIDAGFGAHAGTYGNGDFDQNGRIDADDYFIIDSNYNKAQQQMSSAPPLSLAPSMRSDLFGSTTIDATDSRLIDELL